VSKYWYHIRLSRPATAKEADDLKTELVRLFHSTDEPELKGHDLKVSTPMQPPEAGVALERLRVVLGPAWFVAGGLGRME
jgi:hypothetical protein